MLQNDLRLKSILISIYVDCFSDWYHSLWSIGRKILIGSITFKWNRKIGPSSEPNKTASPSVIPNKFKYTFDGTVSLVPVVIKGAFYLFNSTAVETAIIVPFL